MFTKSGRRTPIAELCRIGMRVGKIAGFAEIISVNTVNTRILWRGKEISYMSNLFVLGPYWRVGPLTELSKQGREPKGRELTDKLHSNLSHCTMYIVAALPHCTFTSLQIRFVYF